MANFVESPAVADRFGVTTRQVTLLVTEGVITATKGKGGIYKYDLDAVTRQYIKYLTERAQGRGPSKMEAEKLEAEISWKKSKARMAELELLELEGKMHSSEDVAAVTADLVFTIRSMLLSLPGKLSSDLMRAKTKTKAANVLKSAIHEVLECLAAYKYDPKKYQGRVRTRNGDGDEYAE